MLGQQEGRWRKLQEQMKKIIKQVLKIWFSFVVQKFSRCSWPRVCKLLECNEIRRVLRSIWIRNCFHGEKRTSSAAMATSASVSSSVWKSTMSSKRWSEISAFRARKTPQGQIWRRTHQVRSHFLVLGLKLVSVLDQRKFLVLSVFFPGLEVDGALKKLN